MKRKSDRNKKLNREENTPNELSENCSDKHESDDEPLEKRRKGSKSKNAVESDQLKTSPKKRVKLHALKGKKNDGKNGGKSDEDDQLDGEYEVEKIISEKVFNGVLHYKIRWKGYGPKSDTWEPEETLNCAQAIEEFQQKKMKNTEPEEWDKNENYEVIRIKDVHFRKDGKREFLVSWKGYSKKFDSWEPEENMDCKKMIQKFLEKCDRAREASQKDLRVDRKTTGRFTLSFHDRGRRLSRRQSGKQRVHYHEAE